MPKRIRPADAAAELARRDRVLAGLLATHGPPRLGRPVASAGRFQALAESIVYQQLNGRAAATIYGRLEDYLDGTVTAKALQAADTAELRACGLSAAKAAALLDLAGKVSDGSVSLDRIGRLADDDVVAELVQVKGIGRWTAEMFLMFTLGRLDVWPVDDYGVRVGFAKAWGLPEAPTPRALGPLGDKFRPYRSIAAWYCWRAVEQR
jgi:DNA-3-methyladenine glycosylase II